MIINHNIAALNTYSQMGANQLNASKNMEKLSSGLRINRAGDDAAGLAISEKMRGQIRGLDQASRNAQDGISLIQTAEGALNETHSILQRMRELSVQSSNDSYTDTDRNEIQKEMDQLSGEIDRIAKSTEFNSKSLLNGDLTDGAAKVANGTIISSSNNAFSIDGGSASADETFVIEVTGDDGTNFNFSVTSADGTKTLNESVAYGADYTFNGAAITFGNGVEVGDTVSGVTRAAKTAGTDNSLSFHVGGNSAQSISMSIEGMSSKNLNVDSIDVSNKNGAEASVTTIENALRTVSAERSKMGSVQNRLEHTVNNLGTTSQNLTAAESRIRDVDMAKEMMEFTKNNILNQASQAMLSQANQQPQAVLQLLR